MCLPREALEFGCIRFGVVHARQLLEVVAYKLVHTRAKRLGAQVRPPDDVFVNGKNEIQSTQL